MNRVAISVRRGDETPMHATARPAQAICLLSEWLVENHYREFILVVRTPHAAPRMWMTPSVSLALHWLATAIANGVAASPLASETPELDDGDRPAPHSTGIIARTLPRGHAAPTGFSAGPLSSSIARSKRATR